MSAKDLMPYLTRDERLRVLGRVLADEPVTGEVLPAIPLSPAGFAPDQAIGRIDAAATMAVDVTPCPQGDDCLGDRHSGFIAECEEGCGFRGCYACQKRHHAEPHSSDSVTAAERYNGLTLLNGGRTQ